MSKLIGQFRICHRVPKFAGPALISKFCSRGRQRSSNDVAPKYLTLPWKPKRNENKGAGHVWGATTLRATLQETAMCQRRKNPNHYPRIDPGLGLRSPRSDQPLKTNPASPATAPPPTGDRSRATTTDDRSHMYGPSIASKPNTQIRHPLVDLAP